MPSILVVDDDDSVQTILKRILEEEGHVVRFASNGKEALRSYQKQVPDLIMTDLVMPEKEGLETIMELRRKMQSKVKIIAMSGDANFLVPARMLGADAVMVKPFQVDDILEIVRTVLEAI
jgi:CheY-like chemotaxis protein